MGPQQKVYGRNGFNLSLAALIKFMTDAKIFLRMKLYPVISPWLFVPAQLSTPSLSIFNTTCSIHRQAEDNLNEESCN